MALKLPKGFVYLHEIDSSIIQCLRYYSSENFIGKKITGYTSSHAIISHAAGYALSQVQKDINQAGYCLVVYDAYRPKRAVAEFMQWRDDLTNQYNKQKYYPRITKQQIFEQGYIFEQSSHSRGSTVDLTIIKIGEALKHATLLERNLKDGNTIPFLDDGTVDMGSSFDLFDEVSYHDTDLISLNHLRNRNFLRKFMQEHGFADYKEEWWHYTLKNEPFPDTYFDFIVE